MSDARPGFRGISLLEVLLGAALTLILLTIMFRILIPLARGTVQTTHRSELQQFGSVALDRITQNLLNSAAAGVSLRQRPTEAIPTVLAVQEIADLSSGGVQIWSDHLELIYHDAGQRKLFTRRWPPTPPDLGWVPETLRATRVPEADLLGLAVPGSSTRMLSDWVDELQITGFSPEGIYTPPLGLRIKLSRDLNSQQKEVFELEQFLHFRNSARGSVQSEP